jgi:hypothetical protein
MDSGIRVRWDSKILSKQFRRVVGVQDVPVAPGVPGKQRFRIIQNHLQRPCANLLSRALRGAFLHFMPAAKGSCLFRSADDALLRMMRTAAGTDMFSGAELVVRRRLLKTGTAPDRGRITCSRCVSVALFARAAIVGRTLPVAESAYRHHRRVRAYLLVPL